MKYILIPIVGLALLLSLAYGVFLRVKKEAEKIVPQPVIEQVEPIQSPEKPPVTPLVIPEGCEKC